MPEATITPEQIAEIDKKLSRAGIKDHQPFQKLLDNEKRFTQFVELLQGREEITFPACAPQKSFLARLIQITQAREIEWADCGERQVEYSEGFCVFSEGTFSTIIDGIQILLIRKHGTIIMNVRNHESFRLEMRKGEDSAVLKDADGLFARKPIRNLYNIVDGIFVEQSRRDSLKEGMKNQEIARALSKKLLERTTYPISFFEEI